LPFLKRRFDRKYIANQIYTKVKIEKDTWSPLQTIFAKPVIDLTRLFALQHPQNRSHTVPVEKVGLDFAGIGTPLGVATPGIGYYTPGLLNWKKARFWPEHEVPEPEIRAVVYSNAVKTSAA